MFELVQLGSCILGCISCFKVVVQSHLETNLSLYCYVVLELELIVRLKPVPDPVRGCVVYICQLFQFQFGSTSVSVYFMLGDAKF